MLPVGLMSDWDRVTRTDDVGCSCGFGVFWPIFGVARGFGLDSPVSGGSWMVLCEGEVVDEGYVSHFQG